MKTNEAIDKILEELARAEKKHPIWPKDIVHAGAIVAEEAGELTRATLNHVYENESGQNMLEEAIHVGATAVRFLKNIGVRCSNCKHLRFDAFTVGAAYRCAMKEASGLSLIILGQHNLRVCDKFKDKNNEK